MLQKRNALLEPVRGPAWGVTGAERFGAYASSGFFWALTECCQSPRSSKYGSHSGRWVDPPIGMTPRKSRLINTTDCRRSSLIGSIDDWAVVSCKPDYPQD